jgi:Zn-dependent M16 (insulinase) family peptidase
MKLLLHPVFTNSICYLSFEFDIRQLPQKYFDYIPVFKAVFGMMGTASYSYAALNNRINILTGRHFPGSDQLYRCRRPELVPAAV